MDVPGRGVITRLVLLTSISSTTSPDGVRPSKLFVVTVTAAVLLITIGVARETTVPRALRSMLVTLTGKYPVWVMVRL